MKNLIMVLGLGVLGFIIYRIVCGKSEDGLNEVLTSPPISEVMQLQPQQKYPQTFPLDVRQDNADQPWYTSTRYFLGDDMSASFGSNLTTSSVDMAYNFDSMWNELSSRYSH